MKYILLIALIICSSQLNAQTVKINTDSSRKKTSATVFIRCAPSIIRTEPLIVIDGFIMKGKNDEIIKNLNPSIVRSINVLKGETAAAIYGAAGAAGVIIITTKNKCEDKVIAAEKCF
jgi:TonB-dependent SusC/RagA subfamily outer membrane receptor